MDFCVPVRRGLTEIIRQPVRAVVDVVISVVCAQRLNSAIVLRFPVGERHHGRACHTRREHRRDTGSRRGFPRLNRLRLLFLHMFASLSVGSFRDNHFLSPRVNA